MWKYGKITQKLYMFPKSVDYFIDTKNNISNQTPVSSTKDTEVMLEHKY